MPGNEDAQVWVSIDFSKSAYDVAGIRGRIASSTLEAVVAGTWTAPFVKVLDVYWFADPPEEAEEWRGESERGLLVRYGKGRYANFAGTLWLRTNSIINIALLRNGSERQESQEPEEEDF